MILVAYGTRPEWIKLKTLISELRGLGVAVEVLFTGQQEDIGEFQYDRRITVTDGSQNRLNSIVSAIIQSDALKGADGVIVQGDTASAFAVALSAFNQGIKVFHVEAGLRTYDNSNPYPEEAYRRMITAVADYHFCPRRADFATLLREGIDPDKIWETGNTVIDTLPTLPIEYGNTVLVTMHRRENLANIEEWFKAIEALAHRLRGVTQFILPVHPNPRIREAASKILKAVEVVPPLPHDQLLEHIAKCKCVISDSGGIQEEASFYRKKVLVCRKVTERRAQNQFIVQEPKALAKAYFDITADPICTEKCPFGDGKASKRIAGIIHELGYR